MTESDMHQPFHHQNKEKRETTENLEFHNPRFTINKVVIKGFKAIRDLTIENLQPFNVFIGKNNSGKSNILSALRYFFHSISGTLDPDEGLDIWDSEYEQLISISFHLTFSHLVCPDSDEKTEKELKNQLWLIERTISPKTKGHWIITPEWMKHSRFNCEFEPLLDKWCANFRYLPESVTIRPFEALADAKRYKIQQALKQPLQIEQEIRSFFQYWSKSQKEKYLKAINNLNFLPVQFTEKSIDYDEEQRLTLKYIEGKKELDIYYLGMGCKRLLTLLFYLEVASNGIIIDEIENSLHSSLIRKIHQYLLEQSVTTQFFIATHSPIFLNYSQLKSIYLVKKSDDNVKCIRLTEDIALDLAIEELGVRNSDVLMVDSVMFVEGVTDIDIFKGFASFLDDVTDQGIQFVDMQSGNKTMYYVALLTFLKDWIGYENIIYVLDGDEGNKQEKVEQLHKSSDSKLEKKDLEKVIHVLSKQSIEGFLLDVDAISKVYNFPREEVKDFLDKRKNKKDAYGVLKGLNKINAYGVLRGLVKHLSKGTMTYKKKDGIKIVQQMKKESIHSEIKNILRRLSTIK